DGIRDFHVTGVQTCALPIFRCKQGELDLIMLDKQTLVIIEVRFRKTDKYGSALESVTQKKQSRIIAATHLYLSINKTDKPIRFRSEERRVGKECRHRKSTDQ